MSALPKNVRAQVDRANKLAQEYQQTLSGEPAPAPAPAPDANAPAPNAEPGAPAPAAAAPAAPVVESTTKVEPIPQESYEQKYKVLQGKYNAEVPRLQKQVGELTGKLGELSEQLTSTQRLLASFAEQRASVPAPTPAAPAAPARLVKDEEVREFGADLIDVVRRVAREEQAALLPEVDRRVAPVAQRANAAVQAAEQVGARVAQSDQQTVHNMLNEQVPDWMQLNEDAGFLEWLDQRDPFSGQQRGVLLNQAYRTHDGPRVVQFFKGYQKEHAVVTPAPAPAPAAAAPAPQRKLEQLVAPGTPKSGPAVAQDGSGKRVWTRAEISKFYTDKQNSPKTYTAEEWTRLERDIFAAQREGRVR